MKTEYCKGECGHKGEHEIVYCVKCNLKMNPCDEMPNPIEYDNTNWICDQCYEVLKDEL